MNLANHYVWKLSGNYFESCHKITSEPEGLLFLLHRIMESMVCPLTDIVCPHNVKHAKDEFLSMLILFPPSCSFSSSSLIFFFLMKLKSSKVLFRFAPLPSLAIISSKPWALTRATSNCTDWCFCKCGQLRQHLWHTNFIVLYRQNNCFIASVPIWLPTNY